MLQEQMLRQLGIKAEFWQILPTITLSNGQVNLQKGEDVAPDSTRKVLMFNFQDNEFNVGEGGVRVTGTAGAVRFYTEGSVTQSEAIVVGVQSGTKTAELDAITQIATAYMGKKKVNEFQQYAQVTIVDGKLKLHWIPGAVEKLPTAP